MAVSQPQDLGRLAHDDLVPDSALDRLEDDDLDHLALAQIVSDLVQHVRTPANVAIFGPYGSGKSSLYGLVEAKLRSKTDELAIVRYDAWKFGGHQLQRNFLMDVAHTLGVSQEKYLSNLFSAVETTRLRLARFLWINRSSLILAFVVALLVAATWLILSAEATVYIRDAPRVDQYLSELRSTAIVFAAVVAGLLLSNQALASATEKRSRSPIQDADQFSIAFRDLVSKVTGERSLKNKLRRAMRRPALTRRLVVLIDELDRCSPSDVVATLANVKTFLNNRSCVFVVAVDRQVLESALESVPQAKPLRESEPYYSTAGAFIDKIFQHQISLPPVRPEALTSYAKRLANRQGGIWNELRLKGSNSYDEALYSLVPAHVQSPRRVKVLMNNFVTNARMIQARGLAWRDRPAEIAVLTVLQTEFPAILADLLRQPKLLEAIIGLVDDPSMELREAVQNYRQFPSIDLNDDPDGDPVTTNAASPAGVILADRRTHPNSLDKARQRINSILEAYLSKIHAAGIPFPGPELIYLQQAAHVEGLTNPALGQLLDFATDIDPGTLVSAFAVATTAEKQAAIRALTARASGNVLGPSRANLIESICRIGETFEDIADAEAIAGHAASVVLAEARMGRWRPQATPGAIILTLLDSGSLQLIETLGHQAHPVELAKDGFLARLLPFRAQIGGARAELIDELFAAAYSDRPEVAHVALARLPEQAAGQLWESLAGQIRISLEALPASMAEDVHEALQADMDERENAEDGVLALPEGAEDRYARIIRVVAKREEPCSVLGAGVLLLGMRSSHSALRTAAWAQAPLLDNAIPDARTRNMVAFSAIAHCNLDSVNAWVLGLDQGGREATGTEASAALGRLVSDLEVRDEEQLKVLPEQFAIVASCVSDETVAEAVGLVAGVLDRLPFTGNEDLSQERRRVSYELLEVLAPRVGSERIQLARMKDLEAWAKRGPVTTDSIARMQSQITILDRVTAKALDDAISKVKTSDAPTRLAYARLRVTSRVTADMPSLSVSYFGSHLGDDAESAILLSDWLDSKPPLRQVEKALRKSCVGYGALDRYASTRTLTDRTKLWITLFDERYSHKHLEAVGRYGIGSAVVKRLVPDIISANVRVQKELVNALLCANLSKDPDARIAATTLAIGLLERGLIGSAKLAVQIVKRANCPGYGQKRQLRTALDNFINANPGSLDKEMIRWLDERGLLIRRKSSPLAGVLGWAFKGLGGNP